MEQHHHQHQERTLSSRVAELSVASRERIIEAAGVKHVLEEHRRQPPGSRSRHDWGFARLPSLDYFYRGITNHEMSPELREAMAGAPPRQVAYACVRPGSIVWGKVVTCRPALLVIEILNVVACDKGAGRPKRWSFEASEQITGQCMLTEAQDGASPVLPVEFPMGTPVLAIVLSVTPVIGHIALSMKSSKLPRREALFPPYKGDWGSIQDGVPALGHAHHVPPAGPAPEDFEEERRRNAPTPYLDQLERDCDFGSPHSLRAMQVAFKLEEGWSVVEGGSRGAKEAAQLGRYLESIKSEVRQAWATESVRRGVAHAKGGDYATALKCYGQALELDAHHKDAYVARGAALANQHRFRDAAEDFERALEIDPSDENAKKYLATIKEKHPEACKRLASSVSASRKLANSTAAPSGDVQGAVPERGASTKPPEGVHAARPFPDGGGKGGAGQLGRGGAGAGAGGIGGAAGTSRIPSAGGVADREYNAELERELAAAVEERKKKKKDKSKKEKSSKKKKSKKRRRSSSSDSET